jgi:DNA-binding response OmpR family regulator
MGYKLLLADDNITIQKIVELILPEKDYSITSVNNGNEAFETAKRDKPDIILADVIMPGTDGYQLCKKIKEDPDLVNIPVLLLAGVYESFDSYKASDVGADDYIIKPFESHEFIKKVKDCIDRVSRPILEITEDTSPDEDKMEISVEPLSIEMLKEEIFTTTEKVLRGAISSFVVPDTIKTELRIKLEGILSNAIPQILQTTAQEIENIIKETLNSKLDTIIKDIVEKISLEIIPDSAENLIKKERLKETEE